MFRVSTTPIIRRHKTITTASGTVQLPPTNVATLRGGSCTKNMTSTVGCSYSFVYFWWWMWMTRETGRMNLQNNVDKKNQLDVIFLLFISLLLVAQHVSGNHVPIIRSWQLRDVIASCWYVLWLQKGCQDRLDGSASMGGFLFVVLRTQYDQYIRL